MEEVHELKVAVTKCLEYLAISAGAGEDFLQSIGSIKRGEKCESNLSCLSPTLLIAFFMCYLTLQTRGEESEMVIERILAATQKLDVFFDEAQKKLISNEGSKLNLVTV